MPADLDVMRQDWETGDYGCSFEDFCEWWLGQPVAPEIARRAERESLRINMEHARKLDLELESEANSASGTPVLPPPSTKEPSL